MAGVNKSILLGNLGRDPEVRHLDNGRAVATCSIATSESYRDKNGDRQTVTEWHNIVLWTPLAEIAEKYLKKGSKIYVEGKLTHRSYQSDGTTKYITEVVVRDLNMLDTKPSGPPTPPDPMSHVQEAQVVENEEDFEDLPF